MRLGVVGMLPSDFRTISPAHLQAIQALNLTGAGFHASGELLPEITAADCHAARRQFDAAGLDLVQFGIGYRTCLFHPDADVRRGVIETIERGLDVAHDLGAHACLIRTGSLSPSGSYSPSRQNLTPESRSLLLESLSRIAEKAERIAQTVVIETHLLTIMDSPETNAQVIGELGTERVGVVMDYVNHIQSLPQLYHSTERLNHIFDVMGPIAPVGHCKDACVRDGFVIHIDEEVPGEGELDLATVLRRWHALRPDGYMLLEHLPAEQYPLASRNTHRIAAEAGVPIH